jgi:hypothetical protein
MFWQGVILVAIPDMPSELMPDSLNISMTLTHLFRVRRSAKTLRVRDSGELQILG